MASAHIDQLGHAAHDEEQPRRAESSVVESHPLRQRCGVRLLESSHSRVTARNGMKKAPSTP